MNELALAVLVITARLSWYDPALCPLGAQYRTNCYDPDYWWQMSGGLYDARAHYWRALSCPTQFPLGTKFFIEGSRWGLADGEWECLDAGGAIYIESSGIVRLDLLTDRPIWGDVLPVAVVGPGISVEMFADNERTAIRR